MHLYWVTTEDHDEDWFIVARSYEEAQKLHEDQEGYDPGEAFAEEILAIPGNVPAEPGWPSHELLLSLDAKFLSEEPTRVVEIDGRRFCEGMLGGLIDEIADNVFERIDQGRPNKTSKSTLQ